VVLSLAATAASAETLADAIAMAYQSNPTLQQQRATQRALDETVVQAKTLGRPTLTANYAHNYQDPGARINILSSDRQNNSANGSLSAAQPIYTGGRTTTAVNAAEADVLRGRENLRVIEEQVMASVVQAYADVVRDVESLKILQANVGVLQRQLEEAKARFEVGEITRTDVAQAEARLADAQASLSQGQAQLAISRAAYTAVVGQAPGDLAPLPTLSGVPDDFDAAADVAQQDNPTLRAAQYQEQAARARVAQARAEYRPNVNLRASYLLQAFPTSGADLRDRDEISATATVQVPIFTGGLNGSRVRQALENNNAALIAVDGARRTVLQNVSQAWAQVLSARAQIASNEEQVRANQIAAEGVRQEAQVGLRTTLDVLNAELELRNSQLALTQSRRNAYVATAVLLQGMGRLEAKNLVQDVQPYDPKKNFDRVKNKGAMPWDPLVSTVDKLGAPSGAHTTTLRRAPVDMELKKKSPAQAKPRRP
jgi:outer membrane protein